jgi:hypothetical protein
MAHVGEEFAFHAGQPHGLGAGGFEVGGAGGDERLEAVLVAGQLFVLAHPFGDVLQDGDAADDLAGGVAQRGAGHGDRQLPARVGGAIWPLVLGELAGEGRAHG